jgi:hypothetical protein
MCGNCGAILDRHAPSRRDSALYPARSVLTPRDYNWGEGPLERAAGTLDLTI